MAKNVILKISQKGAKKTTKALSKVDSTKIPGPSAPPVKFSFDQ